jgi:flagellar motor switch protein FliN
MCPKEDKEDTLQEEKLATSPDKKTARKAKFEEVNSEENIPPKVSNIEGILDVPMEVSVRLGKTTLSIQELLNTGPGSIVELDSIAGGTVDILINNRIFARGEIIVIEERFGVRITALINPEERIQQLGK